MAVEPERRSARSSTSPVLAWIDDALLARVGADYVARTRATLASLVAGAPADA